MQKEKKWNKKCIVNFKKTQKDRKRDIDQAGQIAQNKNVSLNANILVIMLNTPVQ